MTTQALAISFLTLLWQGDLGEQRTCFVTRDVVLVPMGTTLVARAVKDGEVQWKHVHEEQHGPLRVPCRIQGLQLLPAPVPRLPGLPLRGLPERGEPARPVLPASVCLAGQKEIHCLGLASGRVLWKAPKEDGCVLSIHRVGDVDSDGTEDVVACGCNYAECFGGRTGAALWKYPVSGRSLWAGPCGDLDGDGMDEVLLQAGTSLRVLESVRGGQVNSLFEVEGFLPRATVPEKDAVLVAFGGAEVWRWKAGGKGKKVWGEKAHLLDAIHCGGRSVIVTREGLYVAVETGGWKRLPPNRVRAVACSRDSVIFIDDRNDLWQALPATGTLREIQSVTGSVDGLAVDREGGHLCVLSAGKYSVYHLERDAQVKPDRQTPEPPDSEAKR